MTDLKVKCQCCGHFQRVNDIEALKKRIRADAIEECKAIFRKYMLTKDIERLDELLEQLKEQKNG